MTASLREELEKNNILLFRPPLGPLPSNCDFATKLNINIRGDQKNVFSSISSLPLERYSASDFCLITLKGLNFQK